MNYKMVAPVLLGIALVSGGTVAHANIKKNQESTQSTNQSPATTNGTTTQNGNSGQNNGQNSTNRDGNGNQTGTNRNGTNNTNSNNTNSGRGMRRGERMRNDRNGTTYTGSNNYGGDMSPNPNGVVGDPWGFSDKYMGIDDQTDARVREVFNENRNRIHLSTDPVDIDPAPMDYPAAAPGSLDVYHYTDYTHNDIAEGSVSDVRYRKERILMHYHHAEQRRLREMMRNNGGTRNNGTMSTSP